MQVISPGAVYLINMLPTLRFVLQGVIFVAFLAALISAMLFDTSILEENQEKYGIVFICTVIVMVISLVLLLIIPTRETVIQMIIANSVTVEDFKAVKTIVENLFKK